MGHYKIVLYNASFSSGGWGLLVFSVVVSLAFCRQHFWLHQTSLFAPKLVEYLLAWLSQVHLWQSCSPSLSNSLYFVLLLYFKLILQQESLGLVPCFSFSIAECHSNCSLKVSRSSIASSVFILICAIDNASQIFFCDNIHQHSLTFGGKDHLQKYSLSGKIISALFLSISGTLCSVTPALKHCCCKTFFIFVSLLVRPFIFIGNFSCGISQGFCCSLGSAY